MRLLYIAALFGVVGWTGIVDRVAVIVGNQAITESELMRDLRLTALLNGQAVDMNVERRREAADRLVDQQLIRREMEIGGYAQPTPAEGDAMLRQFRQEHYSSLPQFHAALEKYGISEEDLKQHLLWQLAVMRFTDQRFHAATRASDQAWNGTEVDEQLEAWLKEARKTTRIQFKPGVFQ
jgi:hypothetical protein